VIKLSTLVSVASWASLFCLTWLMLADRVQTDAKSVLFWMFFLIVALVAGVLGLSQPITKGRVVSK
jgi:hypothetical protein